jgi:anaerobic magnesium-protoporphyrin IX monomethyl ester cyclase
MLLYYSIGTLGIRKMLDLLLINLPSEDYPAGQIAKGVNPNDAPHTPLGLQYVASDVLKGGHTVGIYDAEREHRATSEILSHILETKPRWIGMAPLAPNLWVAAKLIDEIRQKAPDIQIMVGGPLATQAPERLMQDPRIGAIDALVVGDGEDRVSRLLNNLDERTTLPGVLWKDSDGQVHRSQGSMAVREPGADVNLAVDPAFRPAANETAFVADMIASRGGCPLKCSFCSAAGSITFRRRSAGSLIAEIHELADAGFRHIRFTDEGALLAPKHIMEMATTMSECNAALGKRSITWAAHARIETFAKITSEEIDALYASGCRRLAMGIESGSEDTLARMNKRISPEKTLDVVGRIMAGGINVTGFFILGSPGETQQDIEKSLVLIQRLRKLSVPGKGGFWCSPSEFRLVPETIDEKRLELPPEAAWTLSCWSTVPLHAKPSGMGGSALGTNHQFSEVPLEYVRDVLNQIALEERTLRVSINPVFQGLHKS